MDVPRHFVYKSGSTQRMTIGIMLFIYVIVMIALTVQVISPSDGIPMTIGDLILPVGAVSLLLLGTAAIAWLSLMFSRWQERRTIEHVLNGDRWLWWQFSAEEWQAYIAERRAKVQQYAGGGSTYLGMGLIMALFMGGFVMVAGTYVMPPVMQPFKLPFAIFIVVVVLGFYTFGYLNDQQKKRAAQEREMSVPAPRVYFAADGAYHETEGYTSLKRLIEVEPLLGGSRPQIILTTLVTGRTGKYSSSTFPVSHKFMVPHGREQDAAALAERYRQVQVPK